MNVAERKFWWWTSVVLVATAISGACFPRAVAPVLIAQFGLGMFVGIFSLLWPPCGPGNATRSV